MQSVESSTSSAQRLKSFSSIRTSIFYCLAVWTVPLAALCLEYSIQKGFNFEGMTIDQARILAALADLLLALMLFAYLFFAKRSKMSVLPFVLYFSWTAASQLGYMLSDSDYKRAIVMLLFLTMSVCGLATVKSRQITAYVLVLVNLYFLGSYFNAEVIHGSFQILILPN